MSVASFKRGDATISDGRMTSRILTGDRVRLKEGRAKTYLAAYQFNPDEIRTVIRIDQVPNGERLYVEGAPFMLWKTDCELAWNSPDDRKKALREAGWTC